MLLHRQVSITDLEKQLEALDLEDSKHENMKYRQMGNVLLEGDDATKKELTDELGKQLSEYGNQLDLFKQDSAVIVTAFHEVIQTSMRDMRV